MKIDLLSAPAMVTWQLTQDCNLACVHCCTDSAPGRKAPGELSADQAQLLARQMIELQIPYVMLVGGEPTIVPWFWDVAEQLGRAGTFLKIETNGQTLSAADCARLARLPIRSIQISLDGASQQVYGKMRPGGSLDKALVACQHVRRTGLPLEITFAPTLLNLHEAEAVIGLSAQLGAFRFNTGKLMHLGTAVKLWDRLNPSQEDYEKFYRLLVAKEAELAGRLELLFRPFSLEEELAARKSEPSATLLINPSGKVQMSGPLKQVVADLRAQTLAQAWDAYRAAWKQTDLPAAPKGGGAVQHVG
jgi:MoaA/NifB/PqqE/SkfB family radical SAM enzyme